MRTQQRVCPSKDKLVNQRAQLACAGVGQLFLFVAGIGLAACENGMHVGAAEAGWSAENPGVCKVDHCVELLQVVLHGCTAEQHATAGGQACKSLRGGCVCILEAVGLGAKV